MGTKFNRTLGRQVSWLAMDNDSNDIIESRSLLEYLLSLAQSRSTGHLMIQADDQPSWFAFQEGVIVAASFGPVPDALVSDLALQAELVTEKMIKKASRRMQSRGLDFPTALSQEGGPLPARLRELVGSAVQEELWRLAGHEDAWWRFEEEPSEDPLYDPAVFEIALALNVEFLVVDIAGRESNWDVLDRVFPGRLEVLVTRAASRRYFDAGPAKFEDEQSVLVLIDGERDIEEVQNDSPLDPFTTLKYLHRFKVLGEVRGQNPAELIQVAAAFKARGRFDKCLKLYLHAEELGQSAFDLDLTIGSIYETTGQEEKAFERYISFAVKCLNAGERGSGTEAFRRAVALRPSNVEVREKFLQMLDPVEDREEYLGELRTMLKLAKTNHDSERTRGSLCTLIAAGAAEAAEFSEFVAFVRRENGPKEAFQELYRIAQELITDGRRADALPVIEAAAEVRPDNLETQRTLAEIYLEVGRTTDAAPVLVRMAGLLPRENLPEAECAEQLDEIYRRLVEVDPNHADALRHLAGRAGQEGEAGTAIEYLRRLKTLHQEEGDLTKLSWVLSRLVKLQPEDPDLLLQTAECQFKAGRRLQSAETLREAATMLARRDETRDQAETLFRRVLEVLPLDRPTRRELANLSEAAGRRKDAARHWDRAAEIALAEGDAREAASIYERRLAESPDESDYLRRAARAWLALISEPGAEDRLHDILEKLIQLEDFGFVRWLINASGNSSRLRALLSTVPDLRRIKLLETEIAHQKMVRRDRRRRAAQVARSLKTRLEETQAELEDVQQRFEERFQKAREEWITETQRREAAITAEIEVKLREQGVGDGLGGGIKQMETSFNLPSSIRDITNKLKGLK